MQFLRLAVLPILMGACGACLPDADAKDDNVVSVAADDPQMEAAKKIGRKTLPEFLARLDAPRADETDFSVKFDLDPAGEVEYIWANNLQREANGLSGTLSNEPISTKFRIGQRVSISFDRIIDWGYYKGNVMQGHHTTRALLDTLPAEQANQYRAALGWN